MRVAVHISPAHDHHRYYLGLFAEGLKRHGVTVDAYYDYEYRKSDVSVVWGMSSRGAGVIDRAENLIVLERGFLGDRTRWTAVGIGGHAGLARYCNRDMPGDRLDKLGFEPEPWSAGGSYVLLIGQVPGDASLRGLDMPRWIQEVAPVIESETGLPVRYRPHPLVEQPERSLAEDLRGAVCAVTYNSTAGVDAVMHGCPVITLDHASMAWPVAGHSLEDLKNPPTPDRTQWLRDLVYAQWTRSELANGEAWEHIRQGLN